MYFRQKVNFEPLNRAYAYSHNIQYMFILSIHLLILVLLLENFEFGPYIFHIGIIISKISLILICSYKYLLMKLKHLALVDMLKN
jgi:hypothetical protein